MQKRKVFIALSMAVIAGQNKLAGVFRFLKDKYGDHQPWDVRLVRTRNELTPDIVRRAASDGMDGFIVSIPDADEAIHPLADISVPTVVIDIHYASLDRRRKNIAFIRRLDDDIGRMAAQFLLGQGMARSYAYLHCDPITDWSRIRFESFKQLLNDNGHWCDEIFTPDAVAKLKRPAAVFVANDYRAFELENALAARRISVPRGVSVLGVDNDEMTCENAHPRLSSIQPDFEEEGRLAAETLDAMMNGADMTGHTIRVGVKRIVQRDSTAEQSLSGRLVQKAMAYIDRHALEGIGVMDVVRHLKCSRRLADLRFRELQGRTILDAITERRLDEVKRRLARTRETIDAIASACGYGNSTYLMNLFKKHFGMSMGKFRNSARGP